jgi:copper homeostasis protein
LDTSTSNNRSIFYGGALYPPEDSFEVIDSDYISEITNQFHA